MENASKALIIAGAILLAILIISLGIMIYNQASGVVNNNAMSEVEIQQFNQKFTQYEGSRVRGATVEAMVSAVLANNTSQDDDSRKVGITGVVTLNDDKLSTATNSVTQGGLYEVKCTMGTTGGNKGLVNSISVTKAAN